MEGFKVEGSGPNAQPLYTWDEFGFRVEEEDGPEDCSSKLLSIPFVESPRRRVQWAVELQLGNWENLKLDGRLDKLVGEGVPHSLRPILWPRLLNTEAKKTGFSYKDIVSASRVDSSVGQCSRQIEKDLLRTLPTNFCFARPQSTGVERLRRILLGLAHLIPDVGYCQGMGMIAASLLLFLNEEDTFWMMACIVQDLLPASYYSANLWGAQADQLVLRSLIARHLPALDKVLSLHSIEISLITLHWFLTLFTSVLHIKLTVRVWDKLFHEGATVIFKVALAMLKLCEESLIKVESSAEIFSLLSALPSQLDDVDLLLQTADHLCQDSVDADVVEGLRRKHLSAIMSDLSSYSKAGWHKVREPGNRVPR